MKAFGEVSTSTDPRIPPIPKRRRSSWISRLRDRLADVCCWQRSSRLSTVVFFVCCLQLGVLATTETPPLSNFLVRLRLGSSTPVWVLTEFTDEEHGPNYYRPTKISLPSRKRIHQHHDDDRNLHLPIRSYISNRLRMDLTVVRHTKPGFGRPRFEDEFSKENNSAVINYTLELSGSNDWKRIDNPLIHLFYKIECNENYYGPKCSRFCLAPSENTRMQCDDEGVLRCTPGFMGKNCCGRADATLTNCECGVGGVCISNRVAAYDPTFTIDDEELRISKNERIVCECRRGFYGPRCDRVCSEQVCTENACDPVKYKQGCGCRATPTGPVCNGTDWETFVKTEIGETIVPAATKETQTFWVIFLCGATLVLVICVVVGALCRNPPKHRIQIFMINNGFEGSLEATIPEPTKESFAFKYADSVADVRQPPPAYTRWPTVPNQCSLVLDKV